MSRNTLIKIGNVDNSAEIFNKILPYVRIIYSVKQLEVLDAKDIILLFQGGEDINPSLYSEKSYLSPHEASLSIRDTLEVDSFLYAKSFNIPMLGICRGSQFLCAMSGGKLVQHVDGHTQSHNIQTNEGLSFVATSTHHQMMYPWGTKHNLIAWSSPKMARHYIMSKGKTKDHLPAEPEIVFFEETKALGIQGHPEYNPPEHPYTMYCNRLVEEYLI